VAAIGSLALLHEARYSLGPIGQRMRAEAWALQPGALMGAAGLVSLAAASWLALAPLPGLRFAPLAALALLAGGAAVVLTDLAGLRKPAPVVTVQSGLQANLGPPLYECSVAVANAGRRSFVLGAPPSLPNGYGLKLERELTPGVWRETHLPDRIRAGGERLGSIAGGLPQIAVPPGGQVRLSYVLTPGSYRVLLDGRPVKAFTLEEPARSMVPAGPAPAEEADLPETPAGADEPLKEDGLGEEREGGAGQEAATEEEFPELPPAEAVVTAVVSVRDRPLVRVELHPEDQEAHVEKTVQLGDTVYGPWTFAEFDTAEQRVTLSDGERFLILRRSEPVELPGGRAPEED
jgi:hypothetical protein